MKDCVHRKKKLLKANNAYITRGSNKYQTNKYT